MMNTVVKTWTLLSPCNLSMNTHHKNMMDKLNTVVYYVTCDFVYLRADQITFKLELERSNYQRDKREYTIKA